MTEPTSTPRRPAPVIRDAVKTEDKKLADVLARSFWDDPILSWLIKDPASRYARMRLFFRAELRSTRSRGHVLTTPDLAGAALWAAPDQWKTPPLDIARQALPLARAFRRMIPVALPLLNEMEHKHPTEPHWYLGVLGTDPIRQGRGVGAALITEITDRCDDAGLGAYLESSKPANVPYYERFGFKVTDEITLPDGPTMWPMWRDPH
jgi:GNAT superfamily N-acetyltransferase